MSINLTKKRKIILEILKKSPEALSVAEVHKKVPDIDLVTVYRNLDLFAKEKIIKQVHLGTEEARYEFQHHPHHHAVCTDCRRIIHFLAPDEKIKKLLGLKKFKVKELEVTVRGVCDHKK